MKELSSPSPAALAEEPPCVESQGVFVCEEECPLCLSTFELSDCDGMGTCSGCGSLLVLHDIPPRQSN